MKGPERPSAEAVRVLHARHGDRLWRFLARLSGPGCAPEDLMQDVFEVALRQQHRFGPEGPPVAWLFGVASKVALASRRRGAMRRFLGLESAPEPRSPDVPDAVFERAEAAARLYAALDRLSEVQRTVVILYELESLSGDEIARVLGCPLPTVWTRLRRGREALRVELARLDAREKAPVVA